MSRKWLPTLGELIDRLSIHQLKEVFIPENKEKYAREMMDIMDDIESMIQEDKIQLSGELIRSIVVLSQINTHIWYNESKVRKGEDQDLSLLKLTHGLNGLRNNTMNYILDLIGKEGRKDWKTDCLAADFKDWEISLGLKREDHNKKGSNNE
jgi:hypothetical protein